MRFMGSLGPYPSSNKYIRNYNIGRPTDILAVAGSILCPKTFGHNFYGHSLPTADSSGAVVSYWRKYGHLALRVNSLESLPRNSVERLPDGSPATTLNEITPSNERILSFDVELHANVTLNETILSFDIEATCCRNIKLNNPS